MANHVFGTEKFEGISGNEKKAEKILNNSNKMLTALVCILAVVCLVAGGIYIDTFHGQGRLLALIGKTNRTQAQEEDAVMQEDTPKESVAVDAGSKAAVAAFGKEFLLCTKDGVKYYTSVGAQKWSDTFSMTSPNQLAGRRFCCCWRHGR